MNQPFCLIVGLGKTGMSFARYCQRKNHHFAFFDTREKPPMLASFKEAFPDAAIYLADIPRSLIPHIKLVLVSPGFDLNNDFIHEIFTHEVPVYGDIECLAKELKKPAIAVTGTNGKSTVVSLLGEMARAEGLRPAVGGNIGMPVLDLFADGNDYDLWVLELSSFQLELTHSLKLAGGVVLNISPDHLDRHRTFESYKAAKQRIYRMSDYMVYSRADEQTKPVLDFKRLTPFHLMSFGLDVPQDNNWGIIHDGQKKFIARGEDALLDVDDMVLKGIHNQLNALAACALAEVAGISSQSMVKVLKSFTGLPHRCQLVRVLDGVQWINDSKGTNVGATLSAIDSLGESLKGKIVLIAGGQGKDADFNLLNPAVSAYVRAAVLIGADAGKIADAIGEHTDVYHEDSLDGAVKKARELAQKEDAVLLSPAAASLDMFKDFNDRGEQFAASVEALK